MLNGSKIDECRCSVLQSWVDPQLTWDPASFGGVTEIRMPIEYMWTPNIVLLNKYDELAFCLLHF